MAGEISIIQEKNDNPAATLELYRLIGEGYKAMQEKREITLEEGLNNERKDNTTIFN